MKIQHFLTTAVFAFFALTFTSCSDDDDTTTPPMDDPTIAELVTDNADYSSLLAALEKTGLDATLAGAGTFTVFAPNNDAFSAFLNGTPLEDVDNAALTQILLNHVLGSTVTSGQLSTGYVNNLATESSSGENLSMYINTASGVRINGVTSVTQADVSASNGVIHFVDAVIPLPTVVTFATADANFSTLVAALTDLTPSTDFVSVLSTANGTDPAPFTVFAPTNDAFAAITVPTDEAVVASILNYHVVAGANVRSTDLVSGTVATLNGDVTIDASAPSVTGGGNMTASNIIVVDVQAANGVIHAIDQVLLPAPTN